MRTRGRLILACAAVLAAWAPSACPARSLGEFGNTYAIVEPDPLEWIGRKIEGTDWDNVAKEAYGRWKARDFRNEDSTTLPKAKKSRRRHVDTTYELEFDIYGADGEVAFPKGYRIDPLATEGYELGDAYVVIDGDDPAQTRWYRANWKGKDNVVLLVSSGNVFKTMEALDERAYYLNQIIVKRLKLEYVPCVFYQEGRRLVVEEFYVGDDAVGDGKGAAGTR